MGNYGIKVSKQGYDVKTTAVENLSLHSEYQNYIIRKDGFASGTVSSATPISLYGGGTFYIDSMFLGFLEVAGSGKWFQPYKAENVSGGSVLLDLNIDTAKSQILYGDVSCSSGTHDVKVYMILLLNQVIDSA